MVNVEGPVVAQAGSAREERHGDIDLGRSWDSGGVRLKISDTVP